MADDPAPRPPRARPLADPSLERLEARAEELAAQWAAALVLARPLGSMGRISLERIAREGPDLCRHVLRAVRSDAALERLTASEPAEQGVSYPERLAASCGARGPRAAVEAVESLRGVLWEGLLEELGCGPAERARERTIGDAADRLANVCAALSACAVESLAAPAERPWRFPEQPAGAAEEQAGRIVIVDERGIAAAEQEAPPPFAGEEARSAGPRGRVAPQAPAARSKLGPTPAEIAIRDARHEGGPAAWIGSIGQQLERYERDGLPFAVVLMEVAGVRPGGREPAEQEIEAALASELRDAGGGALTRERAGRWWLLVPRADRIGAHELAVRLERAAAAAAAASGTAVSVLSGTAVCPEDGTQASALAAQADVGLYAARWESRGVQPRGLSDERA
jgi:hypothetical protein